MSSPVVKGVKNHKCNEVKNALSLFIKCETVRASSSLYYFICFKQKRSHKKYLFHQLLYKYVTSGYSVCSFCAYFSREKLWICMEYCGGGSLQDIYHGKVCFFCISEIFLNGELKLSSYCLYLN